MSDHLSEEQLVSYIHHMLTDAQRETMDQHLAACPGCRARLSDHEALRRRIRYSLRADLGSVHLPPCINFAAIEPRLKSPAGKLALVWIRYQPFLSGVTVLITMVLQAVLLLVLFGSLSQPVAGSTLTPGGHKSVDLGFYTQPADLIDMSRIMSTCGGDLPTGWFVIADRVCDYEMGVDRTVAHSGQASGYVKSKVPEPTSFGALMQTFGADDWAASLTDRRLRMSGYVKTEGVRGWATLRIRVDGPEHQVLRFGEQSIASTTDWERYEILLDVPENGASIAFGISLEGTGQVWVDDLQFEVVDAE